jgi:anion-transporting  ArsA/GET3 family ATPase
MILKFFLPFLFLMALTSCTSKKNFEKEIVLMPIPSNITKALDEANQLRDYKVKLESLDVNKVLSRLKHDYEKDKFKSQMIDLRIAFNQSIEKLQNYESVQPKDKITKYNELKNAITELDTIWKYTVFNFKI